MPAPLHGGSPRALRERADGGPNWEGRGRTAAGRRRVGLEPVTMPRRKQSHPQPVKCEGVKGQGSVAVSGEEQGWGQWSGFWSRWRGTPEGWRGRSGLLASHRGTKGAREGVRSGSAVHEGWPPGVDDAHCS